MALRCCGLGCAEGHLLPIGSKGFVVIGETNGGCCAKICGPRIARLWQGPEIRPTLFMAGLPRPDPVGDAPGAVAADSVRQADEVGRPRAHNVRLGSISLLGHCQQSRDQALL